ncbi:MAG TPA: sigma-70 family RNA polymerase sigma factor [Kofleriaceae bacterium]
MIDLDIHHAAIAAGDDRAFAHWMAGAEPGIRLSLSSFASVVDVEAVLQEALLRVWQVAPKIVPDGRPNCVLRMGVRIARNLAITEVRRLKATPVDDSEPQHFEAIAPDPHLRERLIECRDKLPAKPRHAFDARLTGGEDRDLAAQLGMQLNTFLQNFTRARKLLAECLGKAGVQIDQELAR